MHHFISMMFSLLAITGLQESVHSYSSELTVSNGAGWGTWRERELCSDGTYAAGFSIKVEDPVGLGDDTALNGIRLHCVDPSKGSSDPNRDRGSVQSGVGSWGQWKLPKWCPSGFLTTFQLRVERSQGAGDDTAANNIGFKCGQVSLSGDGTKWGDWGGWSQSCAKGICGLQTRLEEPQGAGDDTALNDVRMYCCD